jgi:translation initiation factor 2B subunit (eIF-2B alpha/beta/delta family)
MLVNTLKKFKDLGYEETLKHFDKAQEKINEEVVKLLKKKQEELEKKLTIFTHCHSTNVVNSLIHAYEEGINFEVYNTETRPLYQGRQTSKELSEVGIEVTTFTDDAARIALQALQGTNQADMVFFGSDAILEDGVINKVGSGMFAEMARQNDIPVYIIADSWKYTDHVDLEERNFHEVWKDKPKKVKVKNLAFEKIPEDCVKRVVSELGTYTLSTFIKKAKQKNK